MRNTKKVAKWEIKRNMKNKTYLIGLFLTPVLMVGFYALFSWIGGGDETETEQVDVFINDQLEIFPAIEETVEQSGFDWNLEETDLAEADMEGALEDNEDTAYLFIDERALEDGVVPVYTSEDIDQFFTNQVQLLETPIQTMQMAQLGLSEEELAFIFRGVSFEETSSAAIGGNGGDSGTAESGLFTGESAERAIPGIFAAFIYLSIVFTGMAIFQSASLEKKDKIAEIILSSVTPGELMQGKVIGYFVLGLIQTVISVAIILPILIWQVDFPFMDYALVPELALLLLISVLGYLLFAAVFVGVGATMTDVTTAGNFQGMVMMLPFLPFIFIGPVFSDPNGLMAQIGTYIPFTSPGVLIMRLSLLDEWPWVEIIIALAILIVSVWLFMKLAGKIFKVGILLYGKNATPGEIWKWIRA
ncbi:ABC transporter permease [Virgibacillus sp. YIM 98842]|uniref:ABC transporter permease n=1 Tax=Virgibacillus sp. YIM 98842 TaxID=2663533 RepID=UPI0013DC81DA|nr:ABC transporter permease [Virgibacillus sp. YIM 98842]